MANIRVGLNNLEHLHTFSAYSGILAESVTKYYHLPDKGKTMLEEYNKERI